MRRRWVLLGTGLGALLLLAVSVAGVALLLPPDLITPEAAARIKEGMTEKEVDEVLGGQKGKLRFAWPGGWEIWWRGETGGISVCFTESGACGPAQFDPGLALPHPSLLARLRRLLPW